MISNDKVVVYIKDCQIVVKSSNGEQVYTFDYHWELITAVKNYWATVMVNLGNTQIYNYKNNIDNTNVNKAIEYAGKLRIRFNNAAHKTEGTNKTVRITVKK